MAMQRPFFNIVSGAHEASTGVVISSRVMGGEYSDLTVGMLVGLTDEGDGRYRTADNTDGVDGISAEFVFETADGQSSGTVTTAWGCGEFETNVYIGSPAPGDLLIVRDGKLAVRPSSPSDPAFNLYKWVVTSKSGNKIRFKTI